MSHSNYFEWFLSETPTTWWHDSADPQELDAGLRLGATGVTTNPYLSAVSLVAKPDHWQAGMAAVPAGLTADERSEAMMRIVVTETAGKLLPVYTRTGGAQGYVCAQVNPQKAADRDTMLAQARRFHGWAPNIAVKLPATAAGLDVLEACAAEGITTTITVSFTVPQVVQAAESFRRGLKKRPAANPGGAALSPCHCFAVIMIGRLDDYLRDVALDRRAAIGESDIRQSGLAVTKRAYSLYQERGYEATLLVAALRGIYHMTELAGARLVMSIHPDNQAKLLQPGVPREARIDLPIAPEVIERLRALPEFVKAYEPDGMSREDFITYGVTQRTLTQFAEAGWKILAAQRARA